MISDDEEEVIPLLEEKASTHKYGVATGRVKVRTVTDEHSSLIRETLTRADVEVERVPVDREINEVPAIREQDDVIIIPVVHEILVVEKRLVLKEEVHVRRRSRSEAFEQKVTLRTQRPVIERERLDGDSIHEEVKE